MSSSYRGCDCDQATPAADPVPGLGHITSPRRCTGCHKPSQQAVSVQRCLLQHTQMEGELGILTNITVLSSQHTTFYFPACYIFTYLYMIHFFLLVEWLPLNAGWYVRSGWAIPDYVPWSCCWRGIQGGAAKFGTHPTVFLVMRCWRRHASVSTL